MTDDFETRRLRALIERPERRLMWGRPYTVTPRLIAHRFGDARKLVIISPLDGRPNYFVARVDSSTAHVHDRPPPGSPFGRDVLLDAIMDAQEDEYGYYDNEHEDGSRPRRGFPWIDWGYGCTWGDPFPVDEWNPTPLPTTGRQRTRRLWALRGRQ